MKSTSFYVLLFLAIAMIAVSCNDDNQGNGTSGEDGNTDPNSPNILFIIGDDIGKDAMTGYTEGIIKPSTPHLDEIRENGLTFDNFWVYPTCSPTRASILTGKYGLRNGVEQVGDKLDESEIILHQYLNAESNSTYATALVGKWHLSGSEDNANPEDYGIDYFAGILGGGVTNYYNWNLSENGTQTLNTNYTTEVITDLARDWIDTQSQPWFLWLAYNAPHTPFHAPPSDLHHQGDLADYVDGEDGTQHYIAAIEAMDTEIGRLLDGIPQAEKENTYVIFIGDNGTPAQVAQDPYSNNKSKGSIYQGGVNTPFFMSGPGVTRRGQTEEGLINGTDLYSTVAQLAGHSSTEIHDSKSFLPLLSAESSIRDYQYSQKISNQTGEHNYAIRNERFKLHQYDNYQELYRLAVDPYENNDLISQGLNATQEEMRLELEEKALEIRQ